MAQHAADLLAALSQPQGKEYLLNTIYSNEALVVRVHLFKIVLNEIDLAVIIVDHVSFAMLEHPVASYGLWLEYVAFHRRRNSRWLCCINRGAFILCWLFSFRFLEIEFGACLFNHFSCFFGASSVIDALSQPFRLLRSFIIFGHLL